MSGELQVRCVVCDDILKCCRDDTQVLVEHLRKNHPYLDFTRMPAEGCPNQQPVYYQQQPPPCCQPVSTYGQSECYNKQSHRKKRENKKKFKYTVETWKPGGSTVICPTCGCESEPIIRHQKNKIAKSCLGALCLFGCWPLCMLPFLMCDSNVVNLYCAHCNTFLGSYDRKLGCVIERPVTAATNVTGHCAVHSAM